MTNPAVEQLIARSHNLGADPRTTNYGGGNTSAKGTSTDPVTGEPIELMWVKGSGGDLGTLAPAGLAVLRLDRARALVDVYPGVEREDEMVAAFDHCLYGRGGAAPSIDTTMHVLVDAPHVDHLHPDAGLALATAADGEELTRRIFGDKVRWVPWRRPGFQLGIDLAAIANDNPEVVGCILGGHGTSSWGATAQECEANSMWIIETAAAYIETHGRPDPFGGVREGFTALPDAERRARALALLPTLRAIASQDRRMVGHVTDTDVVLDFLASEKAPALAELGTSCPDHFLRTKVKPLLLDLPPSAPLERTIGRLHELHAEYRDDYAGYYARNADADSPAIRGADPLIILIPGVGMFSFGVNKQTARVAGAFFTNTINVMRGAEALSTYAPVPEREKFRIEYWALEEAKLQRLPKPKPLAARVALVLGGASGLGAAIARALADEGACVVVADPDAAAAQAVADALGDSDVAVGVACDPTSAADVQAAVDASLLAFGGLDIVLNSADVTPAEATRAAGEAVAGRGLGGIVHLGAETSVAFGPGAVSGSDTLATRVDGVAAAIAATMLR